MPYNINTVMLEGEVASEPKVLAEKEGLPVIVQVGLDVYRKTKTKYVFDRYTIKGYNKHAEIMLNLMEGEHVIVYGGLRLESWVDKKGIRNRTVAIEPYKILLVENKTNDIMSDNEEAEDIHTSDAQEDADLDF